MTLDKLNGRAHRLEAEAPLPHNELWLIESEGFVPKLHLLPAQERLQLESYIARIQPLLDQGLMGPGPAGSRGVPNMERLSDADLEEWKRWCKRGKEL